MTSDAEQFCNAPPETRASTFFPSFLPEEEI